MADIPSNLYAWGTLGVSNSPGGSIISGAGVTENLREIQAVIRQDLAHYNATPVASASNVDLGAQSGVFLDISGTATINSFGATATAGIWKVLRFQGVLQLTHNAPSLILPGGADIRTVANDVAWMYALGGGNWMCASYIKASGHQVSVALTTRSVQTFPLTSQSFTYLEIPAGTKRMFLSFKNVTAYQSAFVRLGTSAGLQQTGYVGSVTYFYGTQIQTFVAQWIDILVQSVTYGINGTMEFTLESASSHRWVCSWIMGSSNPLFVSMGAVSVTLGAALDRIDIAGAFDTGSMNISYSS